MGDEVVSIEIAFEVKSRPQNLLNAVSHVDVRMATAEKQTF